MDNENTAGQTATAEDAVNHPSHYTAYNGLEVIDLTEQMNFNRGNAVKYISRAGLKDKSKEIEDLEKAAWYINREIDRLKKEIPVEEPDFYYRCPGCDSVLVKEAPSINFRCMNGCGVMSHGSWYYHGRIPKTVGK